ncbi:hypothetical protein LTR53_005205 [Teratosphaeriaceae sp. CCFEE 6253]|nr:hypothetical protein LTR53_005205 [Teratosphaeriaceae sp. CCFEE 6253]
MAPTRQEVLLAYRHLFRHALRACQYSKPVRFVVQDRMRRAFHTSSPDDYDASRIQRTPEFLQNAAESKGVEHKLQKKLTHVWWEREKLQRAPMRSDIYQLRRHAYDEFDRTLEMLNQTMGLCIK